MFIHFEKKKNPPYISYSLLVLLQINKNRSILRNSWTDYFNPVFKHATVHPLLKKPSLDPILGPLQITILFKLLE